MKQPIRDKPEPKSEWYEVDKDIIIRGGDFEDHKLNVMPLAIFYEERITRRAVYGFRVVRNKR